MRLSVRHRLTIRYASRERSLVQLVRMTPLDGPGQTVLRWSVDANRASRLPHYVDGFGNVTHLHTLHDWHEEASIGVQGVVETREIQGVLGPLRELLAPAFFLQPTPLTRPDEPIVALAARTARAAGALERLHLLMEYAHEALTHEAAATDAAPESAADTLQRGSGTSQELTHVFVSAARSLGHPARYISGYLHASERGDSTLASHAWAEAWVSELGWVGFDVAQGAAPTECYVRVGVGRDHTDAAPLRSVRRGSDEHSLEVRVQVEATATQ
jgi:transglutaminase-like putative cysteine protease